MTEIRKMKVAILAGGMGTRMQELTQLVPKPMIEIGGNPILWHIMKIFSHYGVNEFCIALGQKSQVVKDYFVNYTLRRNSLRIDLGAGTVRELGNDHEDWIVNLVETGAMTQTGGRVARMRSFLEDGTFFLTYGDGVADVDLVKLLEFHRGHGRLATVTAVRPPSKFGALAIEKGQTVSDFTEKPIGGDTWINGGFFVLEPGFLDYVTPDEDCVLEFAPLERLAADRQLMAYHHDGFWQCIDTARDVGTVNRLWHDHRAPWRVWS